MSFSFQLQVPSFDLKVRERLWKTPRPGVTVDDTEQIYGRMKEII